MTYLPVKYTGAGALHSDVLQYHCGDVYRLGVAGVVEDGVVLRQVARRTFEGAPVCVDDVDVRNLQRNPVILKTKNKSDPSKSPHVL